MRQRSTTRLGIAPAAALLAALGSCATIPEPPGEEPTPIPGATESSVSVEYLAVGTTATWQVSVLYPSPHPDSSCAEDESVESSVMTLDMPSSHVNYSLQEGATEDDARRVAACLTRVLESGFVTVAPPTAP